MRWYPLALAALGLAGVWGAMRTTLCDHERRLQVTEAWRPSVDTKLGSIDAKLDLLLEANGVGGRGR